ncbi:MAG: serine protein kinase RIO [Candidatus Nanoarchaeia archaeon]|nr:serine protein kinase RIO [Candidatus Nanoarchaeia archaeon]
MIDKDKFKTYNEVFDNHTLRLLFELSSKGYFDDLISKIKVGKESNIFIATKGNEKVIVKIYLLNTSNFNKMKEYLLEDKRYSNLSNRKRQIVFTWASREFRNLNKMKTANMNSPRPIYQKENILIMQMIGENQAAPPLKDYWPLNPDDFFLKLIEEIKIMYQEAKIIHADLSGFNVLNFNEEPYIIDVSQSLSIDSANATDYLIRDVENINLIYKKITKKEFDIRNVLNYIVGKTKELKFNKI